MRLFKLNSIVMLLLLAASIRAQQMVKVTQVEIQPLTAQVKRLIETLDYLGAPISAVCPSLAS